ncbi:MAG: c-type cytochrome [Proteobacteria bacterium]|nr:c-type cytochrome [Pseudomonadota bacterium]
MRERKPPKATRIVALPLGIFLLVNGIENAKADMLDTSRLEAWETCALCHGVDGNSRMARFPKLAGQPLEYLTKQLQDFRSNRRHNDGGAMTAMAGTKTEKDLVSAARYYNKLPPPPPGAKSPRFPAAAARMLFEKGDLDRKIPACRTCHRAASNFPWLESQHAGYLEKQLMDFRTGNRRNDPDGIMQRIAKRLSNTEAAELAQFLSTHPRPKEIRQ